MKVIVFLLAGLWVIPAGAQPAAGASDDQDPGMELCMLHDPPLGEQGILPDQQCWPPPAWATQPGWRWELQSLLAAGSVFGDLVPGSLATGASVRLGLNHTSEDRGPQSVGLLGDVMPYFLGHLWRLAVGDEHGLVLSAHLLQVDRRLLYGLGIKPSLRLLGDPDESFAAFRIPAGLGIFIPELGLMFEANNAPALRLGMSLPVSFRLGEHFAVVCSLSNAFIIKADEPWRTFISLDLGIILLAPWNF